MANQFDRAIVLNAVDGAVLFRDLVAGTDVLAVIYSELDPNGTITAPVGSLAAGPAGTFRSNGGNSWSKLSTGLLYSDAQRGNPGVFPTVVATGVGTRLVFSSPLVLPANTIPQGMLGATIEVTAGILFAIEDGPVDCAVEILIGGPDLSDPSTTAVRLTLPGLSDEFSLFVTGNIAVDAGPGPTVYQANGQAIANGTSPSVSAQTNNEFFDATIENFIGIAFFFPGTATPPDQAVLKSLAFRVFSGHTA